MRDMESRLSLLSPLSSSEFSDGSDSTSFAELMARASERRELAKDVLNVPSLILSKESFPTAVCRLTQDNTDADYEMENCVAEDRLYGDRGENHFFMYETLFTRLKVAFPFSDLQSGILSKMGVALSQLHPINWAFIRRKHLNVYPNYQLGRSL